MGGDDDPSVRSLSRMCSNVTYAELHTHDCDAVQQIFDVSWWFFTQRWAAAVAFCFAALATGISLRQIAQHVSLGMHSELRAYTIRILFMVPVYSAESFLGLVFIQQAPLMRMLRQFYEAFALFSFTQFILTYLGTTDELATLLRNKQEVPHIFPFCMLEKWPMGGRFLRKVLLGILQYIPLTLVTTTVGLACWYGGVYGDGSFDPTRGYMWLTLVQNLSQIWALYCLVLLYLATRPFLHGIRPLQKFMCIKMIVFFTWWQEFGITLLTRVGAIRGADEQIKRHWNADADSADDPIGEGLINLIICVEMVVFALAHKFAYPAHEFADARWKEVRGEYADDAPSATRRFFQGLNLFDFLARVDEFKRIRSVNGLADALDDDMDMDEDAMFEVENCWGDAESGNTGLEAYPLQPSSYGSMDRTLGRGWPT